jgi:rubrerythrin
MNICSAFTKTNKKTGGVIMKEDFISTRDVILKKYLDCQEMVRDLEMHSKHVDDDEVKMVFQQIAEEEGHHARSLRKLLNKYQ